MSALYPAIGMIVVWAAATFALSVAFFVALQSTMAAAIVARQCWKLLVVLRKPWSERQVSPITAWRSALGWGGFFAIPQPWQDRAVYVLPVLPGALVTWMMLA